MSISNTSKSHNFGDAVATIGTFDGVHIGHQKIIKKIISVANSKGLKSVILTFFPHPRMVLQPDYDLKLLHTIEEREIMLKSFGLDQLVVKPFTKAFSSLSALDYVEQILVMELKVKHVIIGYDHHFGKNRSANIDDLKVFGEKFNFEVAEIPAQDIEEVAVSSTKIRQALLDGDLQTANSYLGYPFFLTGQVIKGKGLGKTISFPTANIHIEAKYKLIPKNGVYVVSSEIDSKPVYGMMNIGTNPTVNNQNTQSIEVHFFDFDQDLYGKELVVKMHLRLRDEHKFNSLEQLKLQLDKDKVEAKHFIKTHA
ncbi:bifunctional riboflavin kinase/FAD synthetase [Sediminibacter sp. Hel_I_10]|uniref:bifunctional riboflavin kinase/FAD synthetase n=1 Tax=Sediminibacter sp. Hel_I_10 TaxID=1392490 RepID=UPI00068AF967|nr:bifunctional riboflavin kinase/FAD synthetase [Sediminibacter sp. Hel_I_10]